MNRRQLLGVGAGATLAAAPLMIASAMAAPQSPEAFSSPRRRMLSVTDFGAVGDGVADDTSAIQQALNAAFKGDDATYVSLPPGVYKVTKTLRVNMGSHVVRNCGVIGHGARIQSAIVNGTPVIHLSSTATCRYIHLEGLDIRGNGREGHGIMFECQSNSGYLYNVSVRDSVVNSVGGDGLHMIGNVFEAQVINSYFRDNGNNGATMGHGSAGILSAIHIFGCVFGGNGKHGFEVINWAYDVAFHGSYFVRNQRYGLHAKNGCTLLSNCGFEDNHESASSFANGDAGAYIDNFATMIGCTSYSNSKQTAMVRSYVVSQFNMIGCTSHGEGSASGAKLGNLTGNGSCKVSVIGCHGEMKYGNGVEGLELGTPGYGAKFGANWNSRNLVRLGDHRLWVDSNGKLRIKKGDPSSSGDGALVGRS